jgi:hypothetical protein
MPRTIALASLITLLTGVFPAPVVPRNVAAQEGTCARPSGEARTIVRVSVQPQHLVLTRDECTAFLRGGNVVRVLKKVDGVFREEPTAVAIEGAGAMTLIHDEAVLVVRGNRRLMFLDAQKLAAGRPDPVLGEFSHPRFSDTEASALAPGGRAVTRDGRYLFVPQFNTAWISVIDLQKLRQRISVEAVIGGFSTAQNPVGVALDPTDEFLYVTELRFRDKPEESRSCPKSFGPYTPSAPHAPTLLSAHRVQAVLAASQGSLAGETTVGCDAAALALSMDGSVAYTAGHGDHTLRAVDLRQLRTGAAPMVVGTPVGTGPRAIAVIEGGRRLVVANWGRADPATGAYGAKPEDIHLSIVDPALLAKGEPSIIGTVAGGFGNVTLSGDGRTLFVLRRDINAIEMMDIAQLKPSPPVAR